MDHLCAVCGSKTNRKCVSCQTTFYCEEACQAKDHPLHRLLCKKFTAFLKTRPPYHDSLNTVYKLALKFPMKSAVPTLIWVECHLGEYEWVPDLKNALQTEDLAYLTTYHIDTNETCRFGRKLRISGFTESFLDILGSSMWDLEHNAILDRVLAGRHFGSLYEHNPYLWGGSFVTMAYDTERPDGGSIEY